MTQATAIRNHGNDPETVFAELTSDFERLKQDGTLDVLTLPQRGSVRKSEDPEPTAAHT